MQAAGGLQKEGVGGWVIESYANSTARGILEEVVRSCGSQGTFRCSYMCASANALLVNEGVVSE